MEKCNVLIVGGGPAGLFSAKYILENDEFASVILLDKGKENDQRMCIADSEGCKHCNVCDVLCGSGGAGLFSDGKLILDLNSGGLLRDIKNMTDDGKNNLVNYIKETLHKLDGLSEVSDVNEKVKQHNINIFKENDLNIKLYDVLHLGTNDLSDITRNFIEYLKSFTRFKIINSQDVIQVDKDLQFITTTKNGDKYQSDKVILAVGKTGAHWLKQLLITKGVQFSRRNSYIGVRLETLHNNISDLINISFDPKIWTDVDNKKVKIHCVCRKGSIIMSYYNGSQIVGGHTKYTKNDLYNQEEESNKSSFNILVAINKSKINIYDFLNKCVEANPNGLLVQRLGDFMNKKVTNELGAIKPEKSLNIKLSNIRELLDNYDEVGTAIITFIDKLARLYPKIKNEDNLIYAPVIEWLMDTVIVNSNMETSMEGCFAIGDGAGLSQGIVHSAATGILAAKKICEDLMIKSN